jgi:hypothetical protein
VVKPGKTVFTGFRTKPEKTVSTSFEAKLEKTIATGFDTKPEKIILVILRLNHWQTVDLDFKAQTKNSHSLWALILVWL